MTKAAQIASLELQVEHWKSKAEAAKRQVNLLRAYVASPKFQGDDADYIHIRTDLRPKLDSIALELA